MPIFGFPKSLDRSAAQTAGASPGSGLQRSVPDSDFAPTRLNVTREGALGDILARAKGVTEAQIVQVLAHQESHRLRFGDAAVALGVATREDVIWALSQQYSYHYSPGRELLAQTELVMAHQPFSDDVEIFRDLRSQLLLEAMAPEGPRRALAIVSADIGDGKTFIAANLAVAFSQMPGRTLIIDADMRSPRMHLLFGLENLVGLSAMLAGRVEANVIQPVADLPNLYMLPAGAIPPNPLELVQHPAFAMLVEELVKKFDHVIVDTPAAIHGSDARLIASRCGASLVVGRKGNTRALAIQKLVAQLDKGPTKLAGVVMNDH